MPSNDINLVPQDVQATQKKQHRFRLVQITSVIQLVVVIAITVGVVVFSLTLSRSIAATEEAIAREKAAIQSQVSTINLIARVEAKAAALRAVFTDRVAYSRLFSVVPAILPTGTSIKTLSVSDDSLFISGTALGTVDIAKFLIVAVEEGKGGDLFEKAELSAVGVDRTTGATSFTARLTLKEGVLQ